MPNFSHTFGFGATEAHGSRVPDGDTLFQIGSVSKVFTGLMLARLIIDTASVWRPSFVCFEVQAQGFQFRTTHLAQLHPLLRSKRNPEKIA